MNYLQDNPVVMAAVVSAVVSAVVALVSARSTLGAALRKADVDILSLQLRDVLAKRIDAYARVWSLLQSNVSDRIIERKEPNADWVKDFLVKLNACHAEYGVFLTQEVYDKFFDFRKAVIELQARTSENQPISWGDEMQRLEEIWSRGGLATNLKSDMGSYLSGKRLLS